MEVLVIIPLTVITLAISWLAGRLFVRIACSTGAPSGPEDAAERSGDPRP